ncbi:MAG: hypothetical protein M0Q42_09835 [Xanthomonadales bacterium]|nr:hypothetical protein [Xanthomonadales bacterium]
MPAEIALVIAAGLLFLVGLAHSILGERYILVRLFRRPDLPRLFGGTEFTVRTLRFAWHLTTIAWWGLAALLYVLSRPQVDPDFITAIIGATVLATAVLTAVVSRGRHLAWPAFLLAGVLIFAAR